MKTNQSELEFSLMAAGHRKFALLWLLIRNGSIAPGTILFWDEPEANLNPKLLGPLIEILIELQRNGVQIFLATHNYFILKELDLQIIPGQDLIRYHSLYLDTDYEIASSSSDNIREIDHNAIQETFLDLYNREINRAFPD